jgi:predicted permease
MPMWPSSVRTVARHWTHALAVAMAAGAGLGLNIAVFAVLAHLVLRPPAYPDLERLLISDGVIAEAELLSWRDATRTLEGLAGFVTDAATVSSRGSATRAEVSRVSSSLFALLGVQPVAGRVFAAHESDDTAVVAHRTARRLFGDAGMAVGERIAIDGRPVVIVGVLPASFGFPSFTVEFWRPIGHQTVLRRDPGGSVAVSVTSFPVVARLARGATVAQAQAELDAALAPGRASDRPTLRDLQSELTRKARQPLLLLQCVVLLVFALGLCNATLVMYTHYRARATEFAIRAALGASVGRLVRMLIGESLIVALLTAAVASVLAFLGINFLRRAIGVEASRVHLDLAFLVAGLVASCVFLMLASLLAAWSSLRRTRHAEAGLRGSVRRSTMRHALLTFQVAACGVMVVASVSAVSSLGAAAEPLPPSASQEVIAADVHLVGPAYATVEARVAFAERLIARLAEAHVAAAVTDSLPFSEVGEHVRLKPPEHPRTTSAYDADDAVTHYVLASPGYFEAIGWPLLRGRGLHWTDAHASAPVVVITRSLAVERLGHGDAVGQHLRFSGRTWQVVGIVDDVPAAPGVRAIPTAYVSIRQLPPWEELGLRTLTVVARGGPAVREPATRLAEAARAIDPDVALSRVSDLEARVAGSAAFLTFFRDLLSTLACLAITLGAFGMYGVVAAIVTERRSEIAVRLSLGAGRRRVFASVLRLGLRPVALGVPLAVPGALMAHGFLRAAVPGILPVDPWSAAVVAAVISSAAAGACLLPAIRAARIDPATLLKS